VHDALRVHEFLAKNSIVKMDHSPYSPDLTPCDFWLFPKLKKALKGQIFSDLSDIQHLYQTDMYSSTGSLVTSTKPKNEDNIFTELLC
jgi:hypothetical protein